jgi:hypothetical protein
MRFLRDVAADVLRLRLRLVERRTETTHPIDSDGEPLSALPTTIDEGDERSLFLIEHVADHVEP